MVTFSAEQINDVYDELLRRTGLDNLFSVMLLANRSGTLDSMLKSIGQEDLLSDLGLVVSKRVKRVVVIGESAVKEKRLRSFAGEYCPESEGYEFEFKLTYNVKAFDFRKMQNNDSYYAVLAGPMPHSTSDKGDYSSVMARMENEPRQWPHLIRMTDGAGTLKITNNSFKDALQKLLAIQASNSIGMR